MGKGEKAGRGVGMGGDRDGVASDMIWVGQLATITYHRTEYREEHGNMVRNVNGTGPSVSR